MSEQICDAADRVRRFLDARDGHFPIDVLAVVTRTGDRLVEMLSASIGERAECATCSGRGVWMDEPCSDCDGDFDLEMVAAAAAWTDKPTHSRATPAGTDSADGAESER